MHWELIRINLVFARGEIITAAVTRTAMMTVILRSLFAMPLYRLMQVNGYLIRELSLGVFFLNCIPVNPYTL